MGIAILRFAQDDTWDDDRGRRFYKHTAGGFTP
jgi:hypothetical protein